VEMDVNRAARANPRADGSHEARVAGSKA